MQKTLVFGVFKNGNPSMKGVIKLEDVSSSWGMCRQVQGVQHCFGITLFLLPQDTQYLCVFFSDQRLYFRHNFWANHFNETKVHFILQSSFVVTQISIASFPL